MISLRALVVCLAAVAAVPAAADVWDIQTDNDNTQDTDNELIHGSMQIHDLGALAGPPVTADADWYTMGQAPFSSYELVVDGVSGDVADKGLSVVRVSGAGVDLQSSQSVSVGLDYARSLRWENTNGNPPDITQFIRIQSTSCTTNCGADDQYRIRFYETTFSIPRFNCSTGQNTVLLIQNPTNYPVQGHAYFWNAGGVLEHTLPLGITGIAEHALLSQSVCALPQLVGKSGTITISHNARYGDLVGKSVALEPATGFSFDSPMVWRPR